MSSSNELNASRIQLLQTKLYIPESHHGLVSRPRLIERLNQGVGRKLTLISAPAGFGKTSLLADWRVSPRMATKLVGWVSLDQRDNDPVLFWSYVTLALQSLSPGIGERASALLHAHEPQPIEMILNSLLNDIGACDSDLTLVLDDFHVISSPAVSEAVEYLLEHLPPNGHLVIATRSDPPFRLARMRGRGESLELRIADLRFTSEEAATFFHSAMEQPLSDSDIAALEQRTEGWIAGLQLAALSMYGRSNPTEFISSFAGDDRYIVDYLMEEVLHRQSGEVRDFLLHTSILDRLSGPLCNAVTGRQDSKRILEELERSNLFLVPLDDKRHWYRYHHLFGDVLRMRLTDEQPDTLSDLHHRAATWFEEHSMIPEAIEQAAASNGVASIARLLVTHYDELDRLGFRESIRVWCQLIPDELFEQRPRLAHLGALVAMRSEPNLEPARRLINLAETALVSIQSRVQTGNDFIDDGTFIGPDGLQAMRGELLAFQIMTTRTLSPEAMARSAREALTLLPERRHSTRAMLHQIVGGIESGTGNADLALSHFDQGMAIAAQSSNQLLIACFSTSHAEVHLSLGKLNEGRRQLEEAIRALQLIEVGIEQELARAESLLAEVLLEQGDISGAERHCGIAIDLANVGPPRSFILHGRSIAAQISLANNDAAGALDHLEKAREYARGTKRFRYASHLAAVELKVFCGLKHHHRAESVIRERELSSTTAITDENLEEMIAFARYLIATGDAGTARALLSTALSVARERNRVRLLIQSLTLHSVACECLGDRGAALRSLGEATHLAENEGFLRTFTSEGPAMRDLLGELQRARKIDSDLTTGSDKYLDLLLNNWETTAAVGVTATRHNDELDPLTERETEILRLIVSGLRNQEIADQLFISLATVKRHIANAYGKLGVAHRGEAIARLSELNFM